MSVPEQTTFTSSTANGVTTVFPYGFMIADADDLTVEIDGVVQTVGFTVSDVGNPAGGNVTFSVAPANGAKVLRYLDPALKRDEDYPQFGDLLASVLNLDFDRVWLAMQALIARADRSIKLPVDTANEQLISEPAATRAGKLLGFNGDGDAALYAAADVPVTAVSPYIATLLNDVSAEEARATLGVLSKFTAAGTADAMTGSLADSIITSYVAGLRVTATPPGANTVTGPTLNLNALGTKTIKKRDASGSKVALTAGDYNGSGPFDFEYDGTDFVLLNPLPAAVSVKQIQPISASVAANALTISASALSLDFRSATLGSGAVTTVSGTPSNLVISSGSTLGTVSGQQSRIAVLALNNAGTIELAAVNVAGGNDLTETGVISTTAEGGAGAADSANVIYSTTARTNVAYRVIGYVESTQATAGTWATAPSTIQGAGGNAVTAMSSLGYGQTWQSVSRTSGTTYYNTTGRPIVYATGQVAFSGVNGNVSIAINGGTSLVIAICVVPSGSNYGHSGGGVIIPAGASYVITDLAVTSRASQELR